MKLNKGECRVLDLRRNHTRDQAGRADLLEKRSPVKVLVDNKLTMGR